MRRVLLIAVASFATILPNHSLAQEPKAHWRGLRTYIAKELELLATQLSNRHSETPKKILHPSPTMQKIYRAIDHSIAAFYRERDYAPIWLEPPDGAATNSTDSSGTFVITSRAEEAIRAITESFAEGLDPTLYLLPEITNLKLLVDKDEDRGAQLRNAAILDITLSRGIVRLTNDLLRGRLSRPIPSNVDSKRLWVQLPPDLLATALLADHPQHFFSLLLPQDSNYQMLKAALAKYRTLANAQSWEEISNLKNLRVGDSDPKIREVRRRLALLGDLSGGLPNDSVYTPTLRDALETFRRRHGLSPSPVLSATTFTELNTPLNERIHRLIVNLERWRWLPEQALTAPKVVLVNIAGFELAAFNEGKVALQLPTIVGKPYHMTPEFSALIYSVEINPYWNVPYSIAKKEILPALRKNTSYLRNNHMQIVNLYSEGNSDPLQIDLSRNRIRQLPGPWNALGVLKFNLPNPYSIYLHDTPTKHLFAAAARAFSHGCIRVKNPENLALFLLSNEEIPWSLRQLQQEIDKGQNKAIKLATPVPIHIVYLTAWVAADGTLNERHDIYGRDDQITLELGL